MTADTMTSTPNKSPSTQTAIFGGGCSGASRPSFSEPPVSPRCCRATWAGHLVNPSYEAVCGKQTGHAEVVLVEYRPDQIGYAALLDIFFTIHDPTTPIARVTMWVPSIGRWSLPPAPRSASWRVESLANCSPPA